jgi:hypothetical protein
MTRAVENSFPQAGSMTPEPQQNEAVPSLPGGLADRVHFVTALDSIWRKITLS